MMKCKTKYPLMLIHGAAFRDDSKFYNYWGRIPGVLKAEGADIYYSGQDAWGSIEANAGTIRENILSILSKTGAGKINLIAHSKGGLEARYMISSMNMGKHIASLTTISTPHHGSKIIDIVYGLPVFLFRSISFFVDLFFKILGDKHPDFYNACRQISGIYCRGFNEINTDSPDVFYQSYAARMKSAFSDLFFFLSFLIVKITSGDNDGLVTVESAKYGEFKGVMEGKGLRGISHADEVDLRRRDNRSFNIIEQYVKIIDDLREKGF